MSSTAPTDGRTDEGGLGGAMQGPFTDVSMRWISTQCHGMAAQRNFVLYLLIANRTFPIGAIICTFQMQSMSYTQIILAYT